MASKAAGVVTAFDFQARGIDGALVSLDRYRGRVLLIVNVASQCGFTPQYSGLQNLYLRHRDRGFEVLGFPCNQFGRQEPGSEAEIQQFCIRTYGVTFPLFSRIDVNGPDAHPLYRFLKSQRKGWLGSEAIKWNFTKFLVNRRGDVIRRYASSDTPETIQPDIERALADEGGPDAGRVSATP